MKKVLVIEGMDTLQMGTAIVRIFEGLAGVDKATLDLDEQTITVEFPRGALTEDDLCDAVSEEGFEVADVYDD
jgi:copper chaperone CopZ